MGTAIGDLVASLSCNTAPFSSALGAANKTITSFAVNVQKATGGPIAALAAKIGDLLNPFNLLSNAVKMVTGPLSGMIDTVSEAFGQLTNLINPVNYLQKAFNGLMYPLQFCMRQFEGMFDAGKSIDAFVAVEASAVRLQAVMKATGNNAGLTATRLATLTKGRASGNQAAIPLVEAGLKGVAFEDSFRLAKDLAAVMGEDLPQAASSLGTALQFPERAARVLRAAHIELTGAQQQAIKAYVAFNDKASAQAIILGVVQDKIGGVAQAMLGTLGGQMKQFTAAVDDVSAAFGEALAPVMRGVLEMFKSIAEWLKTNKNTMLEWGNTAAGAFKQVTEPVRNLFTLLKTDGGAAFLYLQFQWSRLTDRLKDGAVVMIRLFSGIWKTLLDTLPTVLAAIKAQFLAMVYAVKAEMPEWMGGGDKYTEMAGIYQQQAEMGMGLARSKIRVASQNNFNGLTFGLGQDSEKTTALRDQYKTAAGGALANSLVGSLGKYLPDSLKQGLGGLWEKVGFQRPADLLAKAMQASGKEQKGTTDRAHSAMLGARYLEEQLHRNAKVAVGARAEEYGSKEAYATIINAMNGPSKKDLQREANDQLKRIADNTDKIGDGAESDLT